MEPTHDHHHGECANGRLDFLSADPARNGDRNGHARFWRVPVQFELFASDGVVEEFNIRHGGCPPYEFEGLLVDILARFVNLPAQELEAEIEAALARVCNFLGLEGAGLWRKHPGTSESLVLTQKYLAPRWARGITGITEGDQEPTGQLPRLEIPPGAKLQTLFPWIADQVRKGESVIVARADDLPNDAGLDKNSLDRFSVRACVVIPCFVEGELLGAVSFEMATAERVWPLPLVKRLEFVSEVLAQAISRTLGDERLRASEALLKLAADSAQSAVWNLDLRTRKIQATAKAYELLRLTPERDLNAGQLLAMIHPEDRKRVRRATCQAIRTRGELDLEFRVILADGGIHWVAARGRWQSSPGVPGRLMGMAGGITARKNAENQLRESEEYFRSVADSAPVLLWMADAEKHWTFFNRAWNAFTGRTREQESSGDWTEGLHPEDLARGMEIYTKAFEGRTRFTVQYRRLRHDGEYRWISDNGVPRYDPQGRFAGYIGSGVDITEQKLAEQALMNHCAEIKQLKDRLQAESEYLKSEINVQHSHGDIIGCSQGIRRVLHQVEQVALADCPVLVTGETGTGKELIARAIHRLSGRKDRLMVLVNCAALPTTLVESELFGRERGAYTGALTSQVGRFELANGSTIFLDEIGELSLEVQAKLLRVLQEGEFQRLGSPKNHKTNVRVIAATNRDLADAVRKGKFREDLYYRLCVFPIEIPPLRERADDIPMLAFGFLEEFATRTGKRITKIPRRAMDTLQNHSWPGNIRELRNVIEHSVILTSGDALKLTALDGPASQEPEPLTLAEAERMHILKALQQCLWRIKGPRGAAARLDIEPSTLYSRMQKLGIPYRQHKETLAAAS